MGRNSNRTQTTEPRRPALAAARVALAALLLAPAPTIAVELVDNGGGPLESVLVATRKDNAPERSRTALEPISQISDREPELADPEQEEAAKPRRGVRNAARRTARLASRPETRPADSDTATASNGVGTGTTEVVPQPAKFHGVRPGESTREEMIAAWGEPFEVFEAAGDVDDGQVCVFDIEPFRAVEALVQDDVVRVIRVSLTNPATLADLEHRLMLRSVDPVEVADPEGGALLGVTYPEKGLTLLTPESGAPADDVIDQLLLQPLDSQAFIARAESRPDSECAKKLADIAFALETEPQNAHALWVDAGTRRSVGQVDRALESAAAAVRLDGDNPAYRLRWANCLADAADYDEAVLQTRRVLDDASAPDVVKAGALYTMGRLASLGGANVAGKTIGFLNAAIELADRIATSADERERHVAKDLLVDAHLAIAREIARRDYGNKLQVVGQWIGRASGLAEERIASDGGGLELRLRVAREALGALASLKPTKDPAPWIREAEQTAQRLIDDTDDELFRARVEWELGEAYHHAVRIDHTRGQADRGLKYGTKAIDHFSAGAAPRKSSPTAGLTIGRLYFYLGAINAVYRTDHEEAVGWYEKARPILEDGRPTSEFIVARLEGETLVSMAVSYWDQGERDLAVDLTMEGAELIERAVNAGVLDESALGVPYSNLAKMHRGLGNRADAAEYGELARAVRPSEPRVAFGKPSRDTSASSSPIRNTTARTPAPRRGEPIEQASRQPLGGKPRGVLARRPSHRETRQR